MPEAADYGLKYDEQGKPYYDVPGQPGRRSYVSPVALGGKAPEDTTSIFHSAPQWNQNQGKWETPIDWSNIANIATATALTAGGANALGMWGPGSGGGGALPNAWQSPSAVPGYTPTVAPSITASGIPGADFLPNAWENPANVPGYAPGPGPSIPPSQIPPTGRPPTTGGPRTPIGQDLIDRLKNPQALAALLPLLMMAAKGAGGSGSGSGAATPFANQGQLDSLLNMTVNRAERTDPLHQAVTQLAMSRLPMNVQR